MKHLLAVSALTVLMSLGAMTPAEAAPAALGVSPMPAASADMIEVAQGCGPGGVRDRFGRCVSRRAMQYGRACRPGTHPTPRGCRPNY